MPEPFQFPAPEAAVHLADQQEASMAASGRQMAAFYVAFYGTLVGHGVPRRIAAAMLQRQQLTDLQVRVNMQGAR